ncbi:hypothetical protein PsorP6_002134 [Peronosclerospora sorghi]|uniref:Uncharacterized protein n=1 Tax=Peronosclerospora sorghi TaxID=230839 RepID=A0ACC0WTT1_9STRA|nr:hypothetical protein PsorP6_002134 [Peronosclerospora sorghi]
MESWYNTPTASKTVVVGSMLRYFPNKKHLNTVEKKPALWWKSELAFFCDDIRAVLLVVYFSLLFLCLVLTWIHHLSHRLEHVLSALASPCVTARHLASSARCYCESPAHPSIQKFHSSAPPCLVHRPLPPSRATHPWSFA